MLHLVYRLRLTARARGDLPAFWRWLADREAWFYAGMDMIHDLRWYTVTIGADVHCLEHRVTFPDEAAWGRYRHELHHRATNPHWEQRRVSQDEWFEIVSSEIVTDPPIPAPTPETPPPEQRSATLLDTAGFVTLATKGPAGTWASPVNFVPLRDPFRLLWYSLREARHSRNIAACPNVSGALFRTGLAGKSAPAGLPLDGAQLTGTCREVDTGEVGEYHQLYYELNFPDPAVRAEWALPVEQFYGQGPRRFYLLDVDQWWLYDAERWTVDKHDTRFEVPVGSLRLDKFAASTRSVLNTEGTS